MDPQWPFTPEAQAGAACPARLPRRASWSDVASGSAMAGGSWAISGVVRGGFGVGTPNVKWVFSNFLDYSVYRLLVIFNLIFTSFWTIAFTKNIFK